MHTVLLVDDALELARAIRRELESANYHVVTASDGLTALRLCADEHPDAIILDWMLPRLDGLEVLRRLRAESAVPVLMLTARSDETDRVVGLELGADDYLTKPFSMRELVARVRALLRRSELVQQVVSSDQGVALKPLRHGPVHLDPHDHRVTLDGEPLELTPTEFSLLQLFLRNPGRAFSRAYLLDTVWGARFEAGDRSVDNTILRLRKKLGSHGEQIETVWGVGYRLRHEP
ncbi:MAG: response regulator transcription factor [Anaerolineae bacterium]